MVQPEQEEEGKSGWEVAKRECPGRPRWAVMGSTRKGGLPLLEVETDMLC